MNSSRRSFIGAGALSAAAFALRAQEHHHTANPVAVRPLMRMDGLRPFADRLPVPQVLTPSGKRLPPGSRKVQVPWYRVAARQVYSQVHSDMRPTRFWSFGGSFPGPSLELRKSQPVLIEWTNELPNKHFLPIDHHLHGAETSLPEVRSVVHVHGARVPPESDGYPETWYTPGKSQTCFYPNEQDAAMLWYHDHTMGINRLNVFAGMFGAFLIRDEAEAGLNLPSGGYEIPLIICDRSFDEQSQLSYPVSNKPGAPWVPEYSGDAILINGKLLPFAEVQAGLYRFRILNACNSRFLNLTFEDGREFVQIGSDQGLLARSAAQTVLSIAPGERADVLVDFSGSANARIALRNDVLNIAQFRVGDRGAPRQFAMPKTLRPIARIAESEAVKTRLLSLDEVIDDFGEVQASLLNNQHWHDPVTEKPKLGSTEIWSFVNTTDDTHPIHLHLVRFQVLDRRPFDLYNYQLNGAVDYTGPAVPPEPGEEGWKDTVRAFAQMVTRIIVRFEGYTGRYVWHCHILEHEDNDMMRPYEVVK